MNGSHLDSKRRGGDTHKEARAAKEQGLKGTGPRPAAEANHSPPSS